MVGPRHLHLFGCRNHGSESFLNLGVQVETKRLSDSFVGNLWTVMSDEWKEVNASRDDCDMAGKHPTLLQAGTVGAISTRSNCQWLDFYLYSKARSDCELVRIPPGCELVIWWRRCGDCNGKRLKTSQSKGPARQLRQSGSPGNHQSWCHTTGHFSSWGVQVQR